MPFESKIVRGTVYHKRFGPVEHAFTYPYTFFVFALNELPKLDRASYLFGHNHPAPLCLNDRDYLKRSDQTIERALESWLSPLEPNQRSLLVSSPRYFGYAFNPVNFHLRMEGPRLIQAIAEVNNTFGDTHVYPLTQLSPGPDQHTWLARCPKDFHVSPL